MDIEAIKARAAAATSGPWEVKEIPLRKSELGEQKNVPSPSARIIQTSWIHGQLKAPVTIPSLWTGPYQEPKSFIEFEKPDAEFIAHAREDVPALVGALECANLQINSLKQQRAEADCRFTMGDVADISGSHCPLDTPCQRCRMEDAELQLQEKQGRLSRMAELIHQVTQDECSCGGGGPGESCCAACTIYHRLNGTTTK